MMDEADLIRRAQRGNAAAFRSLYDRHADRVWAIARRMAGDDALAQDFAQDAWIRIHHSLPGFRGEAALSTWIHRVSVSAALDGLKRSDRRAAESLPEELPDPGPAGSVVDRVALERALDRLPDRMREVLVLHDVEGYSHEEIGSAMGVASGTSRSQLFKARAKLRAMMSAPPAGARDRRESCAT